MDIGVTANLLDHPDSGLLQEFSVNPGLNLKRNAELPVT